MQGCRVLSFLLMKKRHAPAGDDDGLMIPAVREELMYLFIASLSGVERGYSRPLGGAALGNSSIVQS